MNTHIDTAHSHHGDTQISDYFSLLKPRVMSLVIFTGLCGALIAPGGLHPYLFIMGLLALAIGAGAAGAFNMWYDYDIDQIMRRTQKRSLPQGRIKPAEALALSLVLSLLSVKLMALATNMLAAGLLAFTIFFYAVIYTIWLKRFTAQNIVIGGAAGAFPPMIGWVMVTGAIDPMAVILFAIIFFWTPPHFWALALFANEDYKKAKIPMMPSVYGERKTKHQILFYTILMWPICLMPYLLDYAGMIYAAGAALLNAGFTFHALRVWRSPDPQDENFDAEYKHAKKMFFYSIGYLFGIFALLVIDNYML